MIAPLSQPPPGWKTARPPRRDEARRYACCGHCDHTESGYQPDQHRNPCQYGCNDPQIDSAPEDPSL